MAGYRATNDRWLDPRVAVVGAQPPYPGEAPFSPPRRYPEFPYPADERWDPDNRVYPAVRRLFQQLGLDAERFDSPHWNPLGDIIRPTDRVVLKPNYILHAHLSGHDPFSVITHSAVVRAVLDYVHLALNPGGGVDGGRSGQVTVADAPQANADWQQLLEVTQIGRTLEALRRRHGVNTALMDLRQLRVVQRHGLTVERTTTDAAAVLVDLGEASALAPLGPTLANLCGSDYDRRATVGHHRQRHVYAAARPVLAADVLISLPKLKVHKKTGVTLNLKNMVGINADKNHIPHYRIGDGATGGDEFPADAGPLGRIRDRVARAAIDGLLGRLEPLAAPVLSRLFGIVHDRQAGAAPVDATDVGYNQRVIRDFYRRVLRKEIRAGNWSGNDTLWRAVLDLNRIALYADAAGVLQDQPQRRYLSIVDGIVGGEGEGPMDPDPVHAGILLGGFNPVLVDRVATRWMGLDPDRVPLLVHAGASSHLPLAPPGPPLVTVELGLAPPRPFRPPAGWPELARAEPVAV